MREHFDLPKDIVYMNTGTMAFSPRSVNEVISRYHYEFESNPTDGLMSAWGRLWEVQKDLATFFKADPKDMILRQNVTIAMAEFLGGIDLPKGSEIAVTDLEYGAIVNICRYRAERDGLSLSTIKLPFKAKDVAKLSPDDYVDLIFSQLSPKTSLLMVSHVMTGTGMTLPIAKIGAECRRRGIVCVIDGAHGAGTAHLDFSNLPVDFYGSNLHKWMMGPKGTGFGWFNPEIKDRVKLNFAGWTTYGIPLYHQAFGEGDAFSQRWMMASTHDFAPYYAIREILRFWRTQSPEKILATQKKLASNLWQRVQSELGWTCVSGALHPELQGAKFAFELPDRFQKMGLDFISLMRTKYGLQIITPQIKNEFHLRLSPHIYNTLEDIDFAVEALKKVSR